MTDTPTKDYGAHSPHNPGGAVGHLLHSLWCIGQLPDMEPARGMALRTLAEHERIYEKLEVSSAATDILRRMVAIWKGATGELSFDESADMGALQNQARELFKYPPKDRK